MRRFNCRRAGLDRIERDLSPCRDQRGGVTNRDRLGAASGARTHLDLALFERASSGLGQTVDVSAPGANGTQPFDIIADVRQGPGS